MIKKKNLYTIIVVVVIAAAGAAAYYYYNQSQKSWFVKSAEATENWAKGVGKAVSGK